MTLKFSGEMPNAYHRSAGAVRERSKAEVAPKRHAFSGDRRLCEMLPLAKSTRLTRAPVRHILNIVHLSHV
jgi:hypothetical protein